MEGLILVYGLFLLTGSPARQVPAYFIEPDNQGIIYLQSQSGRLAFPSQSLLDDHSKTFESNRLVVRLEDETGAPFHCMVGPQSQWRLGMKTYHNLVMSAPGLELKLTGLQHELRAQWTIHDLKGLENGILLFKHWQVLGLNEAGWLELEVQGQRVCISPPETNLSLLGKAKKPVPFIVEAGKVTFDIPEAQKAGSLTLSSVVLWSSVFGDDTDDTVTDFQKDGVGNFLIAGSIQSALFWPLTSGTLGTKNGGKDAFLSKLNTTGTAPVWTSLVGGVSNDEIIAFEVLPDQSVWAVGTTTSTNLPVTDGSAAKGYQDGFLVHFSSNGSILFLGYFGGSHQDNPRRILVQGSTLWVVGSTRSANFPTTVNTLDSVLSGTDDGFLMAVNSLTNAISFSSYWGGSGGDEILAIDIDGSGNIYLGGETSSTDFPTTMGVFDTSLSGSSDAFLTKISPSFALVFSTFLGGTGFDSLQDIKVTTGNEILMTGQASNSFPTTAGAYKPVADFQDAFLAQMNATGGGLTFSTVLGGSNKEVGLRLATLGSQILVAGRTESSNFPTTGNAYQGDTDIFLGIFNTNGTQLLNSQLVGGTGYDSLYSARVQSSQILMAGKSFSSEFPTTNSGLLTQIHGESDGFFTVHSSALALEYGSFLGGEGFDTALDAVQDGDGNIILCGYTNSDLYPTTTSGPNFWPDLGTDIIVSKLSADGTQLLFSSRIGGNGEDRGKRIAIDSLGEIVVAGDTSSTNLPITAGAFDTSYGGNGDGFVLRLSASGDSLSYSTYLGSPGWDQIWGLTLKGQLALVVGSTNDGNFPTTAGAVSQTLAGGFDAFLGVLNATGTGLTYSSFLGGSGSDIGYDVQIDGSNNVYILGHTTSSDFPTVTGSYDQTYNGGQDIFLTRISAVGTLSRSTFLGGSLNDQGQFLVLSSDGPIIAGWSTSSNFPTHNAWDASPNGSFDVVLAKFNNLLSELTFSTYLGGTSLDSPTCLKLDAQGKIWLGGQTSSNNFPTSTGSMQPQMGGLNDMFLHQFSATGSQLLYGTYWGGMGSESCAAILPRSDGSFNVVGSTNTPSFPSTPGAYTSIYSGGTDIVVARICPIPQPGEIVGPLEVCGAGSVSYSIAQIPGISIYDWTVPPGATLVSGQTTTSISVQLNGHAGTISVKAMGPCGPSEPSSIEVSIPPALGTVGAIQGDATFCRNELKLFSIDPVANATDYLWSLPMGATIVSGQGTATLMAQMGNASGDVMVEVSNACAQKPSSPKAVVLIPAIGSLGSITGSGPYCPGTDGYTFSVAPVSGATHYQWNLPVGAAITAGAGTSSIQVQFGLGYGNLSVVASNACGMTDLASTYIDFSDILNIYQQPESQVSCVGQRAEFSVVVDGSEPIQLEWYKDGIPLNVHSETLVIDPVAESDEGSYRCLVETPCVSEYSASAYLTVGGVPQVQLVPASVARGLKDPEFYIALTCETPPFSMDWSTAPVTPFADFGDQIVLQPAPAVTTQIDCIFTDSGGSGPVQVHGLLLVADNAAFFDYNQDGCNNLRDLWLLAQSWRTALNPDANGDHWVDIRDFLYINLDDPLNCP